MKRLALLLAALTLIGALLTDSAQPAWACPPPLESPTPLEEQVSRADLIVTAVVAEHFIDPPLDPEMPDDLLHDHYARVDVTEYLKGSGPASMAFATAQSFRGSGELDRIVIDCPEFRGGPDGASLLLLLTAEGDSFGIVKEALIDDASGQALLRQVRDILAGPEDLPVSGGLPPPAESAPDTPWLTIALGAAVAGAGAATTATWLARRRIRP